MEHDGAAMYVKSSFLLTSVACGSEHTTWLAMHTPYANTREISSCQPTATDMNNQTVEDSLLLSALCK